MLDFDEVLSFWFADHNSDDWFGSNPEFDRGLRQKFFDLHGKVALGEALAWRKTPRGRLAEILVLDQFSRQLYRDDARAFASDAMALTLAQELVTSENDMALETNERLFVYMPFMHSESLLIHDEAVRLFTGLGFAENLKYEHVHRDIITRFGRFPKRNKALGRKSSEDEIAYMTESEGRAF